MRTLVSDITPRLSLRSEYLDQAIGLLTPIHLVFESANENQRSLLNKLDELLLEAEQELADKRMR
jgi:hypothetical protein